MTPEDAQDVLRFIQQNYPRLQAGITEGFIGRGQTVVVHNPASRFAELEIADRPPEDELRTRLDQFQAS